MLPDNPSPDRFLPGRLPGLLPRGIYRFVDCPQDLRLATLAFALGSYQFTRYRKGDDKDVRLEIPDGVDADDLSRIVEGVFLARDLINTPANDLGPGRAGRGGTHAGGTSWGVGHDHRRRRSARSELSIDPCGRPRLGQRTTPDRPDMGRSTDPKVTLVGKGVCFDSGGFDIKPDSAMLLMKKDMGGAAACSRWRI